MILGQRLIEVALKTGHWKCWRDGEHIGTAALKLNPHSIDVTLGPKLLKPEASLVAGDVVDPFEPDSLRHHEIQFETYFLTPGEFVLGYAQERFDCSEPLWIDGKLCYFTQRYDGRSTMGRLGIISHCTAGYGDYGFGSNFTLELVNLSPHTIVLHAGMRIGQISFDAILEEGEPVRYNGSYVEQHDRPRAPSLGREKF